MYTSGVFVKPLADAFNTGRAPISFAVSLLDVVIGIGAPTAGWLVHRHGARGTITASVIALAACIAALGYVHPPLWHLYALYAVAGFVGMASSPVAYGRVVANWFDRKRGLALGLASAGVGLGAFLTPRFAQYLVDRVGWRGAYLGLAAASLLIAVPVVALFMRTTPQEVGLLPNGDTMGPGPVRVAEPAPGMTISAALRTSTFWRLCAIFFCVGACVNGANAHLVPLFTDRGISGRSAAAATSLFGLASIAGRVLNGYLVDRFFAPRVAAGMFAAAAGGMALLLASAAGLVPALASALLGLAVGAESDVIPFLISRYFGMRSMAELYGCAFAAYVFGNATGRTLFGVGFDAAGSYRVPLVSAFVLLVLASMATLSLGQYARPERPPIPVSESPN